MTDILTFPIAINSLDKRILVYAGDQTVPNDVWFLKMQYYLREIVLISYQENVDYHKACTIFSNNKNIGVIVVGYINLGDRTYEYLIKVMGGFISSLSIFIIIANASFVNLIRPLIIDIFKYIDFRIETFNPQIGYCMSTQLSKGRVDIFNTIYNVSAELIPNFKESTEALLNPGKYAINNDNIEYVHLIMSKIPLSKRDKELKRWLEDETVYIRNTQMATYLIEEYNIKDIITHKAMECAISLGNIELIEMLNAYGVSIPSLSDTDVYHHINTLKKLANDNILTIHNAKYYLNRALYDSSDNLDSIKYLLEEFNIPYNNDIANFCMETTNPRIIEIIFSHYKDIPNKDRINILIAGFPYRTVSLETLPLVIPDSSVFSEITTYTISKLLLSTIRDMYHGGLTYNDSELKGILLYLIDLILVHHIIPIEIYNDIYNDMLDVIYYYGVKDPYTNTLILLSDLGVDIGKKNMFTTESSDYESSGDISD